MTNTQRFLTLACLLVPGVLVVWGCGPQKPAPATAAPVKNAAATQAPGTAAATVAPQAASPSDIFQEAGAQCGVNFTLGHKGKGPFVVNHLMGGGVTICDLDGDGHADLVMVAPQDIAPNGQCFKIYRNQGKAHFQDVTAASGINVSGMLMGVAAGDIDNDGLPDLLITGYGVMKLYKNLGGCKFKDVTSEAGLGVKSPTEWCSSAAFADFDNDGKLDVFIGRYVIFNSTTIQLCEYGEGRRASCGPVFYDPQRGSLYKNMGGGKFKDVTDAAGFNDVHGKVLGVAWADLNGDGIPDCYLANDEVNGDLLMSQKGGKYTNVGLMAGVALASDGKPQGGMGVDICDYNRDGRLDIFVTTYQNENDSLYAAQDHGPYRDMSNPAGIDQPTRQMVGFGTHFLDVDNDGWPDVVVANGHVHDNQEVIDKMTTYRQPMQLFLSQHGTTFVDRSKEAGPGFTTPGVGRGLAVGDLDDDGLEDVVIMDMEGPARILLNRSKNTGNWLRFSLKGKKSNRFGLGSIITVTAGKERWLVNCTSGGSYLSSSDPRPHLGIGKVNKVDRVEVKWPSGKTSVVTNPHVPGDLVIEEPN